MNIFKFINQTSSKLVFFVIGLLLCFSLIRWQSKPISGEKHTASPQPTNDYLPIATSSLPVPQNVVHPVGDFKEPAVAVRQVLSETWVDGPEKTAGRERVRVVEADFKFPMLRLTERVTKDPSTGQESVKLVHSSVADHLMVGLKKNLSASEVESVLADYGYQVRSTEEGSFLLVALKDFQSADSHEKSIRDLMALEEFIDYAEPDYIVHPTAIPNDPDFLGGKLWSLDNPGGVAGTTKDADIDAPEAWDIRNDASEIIVAITDTGINYTHEDLAANMWTNGSGEHGFDAYEDDNDPMDTTGHGTHCAGTIGARGNNGIGITGVAWKVKLMAGRFLGPNGGTTSDAIRVINYARLNGANVINASWGGGGFSEGLFSAIEACYAADITFVAAAGNSGINTNSTPHYPSSYDLPNVISVSATDKNDNRSVFSNYGYRSADMSAPGSSILSCGVSSNSSYQYLSGTSMAAPHVSGAIALAKAHFPGESCDQLITRIYSSVDNIFNPLDDSFTAGRLNLHNLLSASSPDPYHDYFSNPLVIPVCEFHWCRTNDDATREQDEDLFSPGTGTRSLWFSWVAPANGLLSFSGRGAVGDVSLVAFEGNVPESLRRIADNFKERPTSNSTLNFYVSEGNEYRFSLDSRSVANQLMAASLLFRAGNDMFVDSFALPINGNFNIRGSNCGATSEPFEINRPHAGRGCGKSVWWHFVPDFSGQLTLTTQGSLFDTVLAVYTGSTGNDLVEVVSNDDYSPLDYTSQVTFNAVAGTTYRIAVDSFRQDSSGDISLSGFRDGYFAITKQPQNVDAQVGGRASFSISVLSATTPTYEWFLNGVRIHGETRSTLTIDSVTSEQIGGYHCEVKNQIETLVSETAYISELQVKPEVTWTSGNQSVASGGAVGFSVRAKGTGPFVYTWFRGEDIIPGQTASTLFLNPISIADAGAYSVSVGNQAGNTVARFILSVVASPFDGFEWRRPGVENYPITDMKSYATEAYAIAGDAILRTTDGVNWEKSRFPYGFYGHSFGIIGNTRVCHGYNYSNAPMVATSVSGAPWIVQPLTGFGVTKPGEYRLTEFKGRLITQFPGTAVFNFLCSTNGVTWVPCQASDSAGTAVSFFGTGQPAADGNTMIIAGADYPTGNQAFYYRTTDGLSWTRLETNAPGLTSSSAANQAVFSRGEFHLIGTHGIYNSVTASTWAHTTELGNGLSGDTILVGNSARAIAFDRGTTQRIAWFDGPGINGSRVVFPSSSQTFTAASFFDGKILYGTNRGHIGSATDVHSVTFPAWRATALDRVFFQDGFFIASQTGSATTGNLISGDGRTWKSTNPFSSFVNSFRGEALGRNWAFGNLGDAVISPTNNPILTGVTPFNYHNPATTVLGLNAPLKWIAENPAGDAIALTHLTSPANSVGFFYKASGASTWTQSTTTIQPPLNTNTVHLRYLAGRWYFLASDNRMYSSANGLTWTAAGTTTNYSPPTEKDGAVFALTTRLSPKGFGIEKTTDGVNWTRHAVTGMPASFTVSELLEFNGNLVALVSGRAYFSPDGYTWADAGISGTVAGIAKGNGQLVVALSSGGILQTGSIHPGISAPLVSITSPPQESSHMIGSAVNVAGELSDPPSDPVSYECFVDGGLVASGSGSTFAFRFTATKPTGHIIEVVATDAHGLKNTDFIRINTTTPDPVNRLTDGDSIRSISPGSAVVLNGSFYALGGRALYRSRNGISWERVEIPSSSRFIFGMASGNGALVLQYDDGSLVTSTNGINWTLFTPNQATYGTSSFVEFNSGFFTSGVGSTVLTSADGITWANSLSNETGSITWVAINKDGFMVAAGAGGIFSSNNGGASWRRIASIPAHTDSIGTNADGRFVIVSHNSQKSYVSSDGLVWVARDQPAFTSIVPSVSGSPTVTRIGDRYFTGGRNALGFSSADGLTWEPLGISVAARALTYTAGKFIAANGAGILTSTDALTWTLSPGSPQNIATLSSNNELILAIGNDGATWTSTDGLSWAKHLEGRPASGIPATSNPYAIESFGRRILLVGTVGMAAFSDDDGASWRQGTVNGSSVATSERYIRVKASSQAALAVTLGSTGRVIRTTNGSDWVSVAGLASLRIADVDTDGTTWLAVARTGEVLRSTDQGLNWSNVNSQLLSAKGVAWFQSRWVIVGSTQSGSSAPCRFFTLENNGTLTDRAAANFNDVSSDLYKLTAHGKLMFWLAGAQAIFSTNGTSWTSTGFNANNAIFYSVYAIPSGFKALVSTPSATLQWQSTTAATSWSAISSPFLNVGLSGNLGNRAFLFGPGQILEETATDFSLAMSEPASVSLGVGDVLNLPVTIGNTGSTAPPTATWKVEAYLSKDGFYGDLNDISLGTFPVTVAMPSAGTQINTTLEIELPERLLTGKNHVVLKLVCDTPLPELNTSNNYAISLSPFVNIPEWELALDTSGNGTINQDFAALSYAHNSRVSLTATAGKGLSFRGWSGDAVGAESEITVLMNGNKSVMATFAAQASLQVLVRGNGQISGLADLGSYPLNATASLTAVPEPGWVFVGWSGAASGSNANANILMNAPKTVSANFILPLSAWKQTRFSASEVLNPLVSGDEADPDHDGVPNWQEYLFASDPKAASSNGTLQTRLEPGYLSIIFTRVSGAETGFVLQSQGSRTLTGWDTPDFQERILSTDEGIETVEARLPTTGHQRGFIRMRFQR